MNSKYLDIEIDKSKDLNSYSKFTISILFTVALPTGFLSLVYVQRAHAFSIDFITSRIWGNQGLNFFGIKGDKGDTGQQGPAGPQ